MTPLVEAANIEGDDEIKYKEHINLIYETLLRLDDPKLKVIKIILW